MARVVMTDCTNLSLNEHVYIREIPNMEGHCVVLRNGYPPLVGYDLDRFELINDANEEVDRPVGELRDLRWDRVVTRTDFVQFCKELGEDYPQGWTNNSLLGFLEALWQASDGLDDIDFRAALRPPPGESWLFAWLLHASRRFPRGRKDPFAE